MIRAFNKATKKFTDYFNYIEKELDKPAKPITDFIIHINSQIVFWLLPEQNEYDDDSFIQVFNSKYTSNYIIYNLSPRQFTFKSKLPQNNIINYKAPDTPAYSLEFIINLAIAAKNYLSINDNNVLIIHDDAPNGKFFSLLSCIISYNINSLAPLDVYSSLINSNETFKELYSKSEIKNQVRCINYFSNIQQSPVFTFKKYYLQSIVINGAPAIDNNENSLFSPYITINKNSFYAPVIRIISNGKLVYCSYKKDQPVDKVFYSADNAAKFDINSLIFNDTCIEVLHKTEGRFKLLFVIQFNTLFINENAIRFSKDMIDGIYKDIRYPNEFFIDLMFDANKEVTLSQYDEDTLRWKSLMGEFILKSGGNGNVKQQQQQQQVSTGDCAKKEEDKGEVNEQQKKTQINDEEHDNKNEMKEVEHLLSKDNVKEEEVGNVVSTINKVEDILNKMGGGVGGEENEENEEDEEDIDDYLKSLENKK